MTARRSRPTPGRWEGQNRPTPAVDASMSLLNDVMYRPVELAYAEAAERGTPDPSPGPRARRTAVNLVIAVLLGVVTVSAVVTLRSPQPSVLEGRTLLQDQIAERSATVEELQRVNEVTGAEIAALQVEALASENPALLAELEEVELLSGAVAVEGPGIVVVLDDPPSSGEPAAEAARVQDIDLQMVTNGLWAAGAEAIAINGERLTALSAIRGASQAILVDLAPLLPPYRVEAIGDARQLQTGLARTGVTGELATLSTTYGISSSVRAMDSVLLPASGTSRLTFASPAVPVAPGLGEDETPAQDPDGGTS